ncbi:MAG: hypothetical protein IPL70_08240 [Uliginosibacterium sp.]|nr:hypothetical protein [Uliginosibacterium sp.]
MFKWPRSAFLTVSVLIVLFGVTLYITYTHTRTAYLAVGFNNGQIDQGERVFKKIQQLVILNECQENEKNIEFMAVKAESLNVMVINEDGVQKKGVGLAFCLQGRKGNAEQVAKMKSSPAINSE